MDTKDIQDVGYDDTKYGFIYLTTNHINGRMYIGQKKYDKRKNYLKYLGSGNLLKLAINKYGNDNFSKIVLENCETKEILDERESYWIDYFQAVNNDKFYNIAKGGTGGDTTRGYTEEQKAILSKKRSKSNKGINKGSRNAMSKKVVCLNNGKIFDTLVDAGKYCNRNENSISSSCKAFERQEYWRASGKDFITKEPLYWAFYDKNNEENYYIHYDEINNHKQECKINHKNARKVKCLLDGKIFNTISDASKYYGIKQSRIVQSCIDGSKADAKRGLVFEYFDGKGYLSVNKNKKINLYEKDTHKFVKSFQNIYECCAFTNRCMDSVRNYCLGKRISRDNYIYRYDDNDEFKSHRNI